jgi:antitoxin MazE
MDYLQIKRWGNSLALRIPKAILTQLGIKEDDELKMNITDNSLVLTPIIKKEYSLSEMLSQISDDNLHDEADFGQPAGNEVW